MSRFWDVGYAQSAVCPIHAQIHRASVCGHSREKREPLSIFLHLKSEEEQTSLPAHRKKRDVQGTPNFSRHLPQTQEPHPEGCGSCLLHRNYSFSERFQLIRSPRVVVEDDPEDWFSRFPSLEGAL